MICMCQRVLHPSCTTSFTARLYPSAVPCKKKITIQICISRTSTAPRPKLLVLLYVCICRCHKPLRLGKSLCQQSNVSAIHTKIRRQIPRTLLATGFTTRIAIPGPIRASYKQTCSVAPLSECLPHSQRSLYQPATATTLNYCSPSTQGLSAI